MYPQWLAISSFLSGSLSFQVAVAEHSMPLLFEGGPYMRKYGMSLSNLNELANSSMSAFYETLFE